MGKTHLLMIMLYKPGNSKHNCEIFDDWSESQPPVSLNNLLSILVIT